MPRRKQITLASGFIVMAVPESGLFAKEGRITTGKGSCPRVEEVILFSRMFDAEQHVKHLKSAWPDGDDTEQKWSFPILAVLVSERL